mgnify:CR=1 FL=1
MLDAVVLLLVLLFMVKFVCAFVHALKECRGELSRVRGRGVSDPS